MCQPVFIIGCARSGTTMLRKILNLHSHLCVPEETHFIPKLYKVFTILWRLGAKEFAVRFVESKSGVCERWNISVPYHKIDTSLTSIKAYAQIIDYIMTQRARIDGKGCWGEKTPSYVFHVRFLAKLFPSARFVHIYRDGRDVMMSMMPLNWGPNNAYMCALYWKSALRAWMDSSSIIRSDRRMDIRYESFVTDPHAHLENICAFLGIPYESNIFDMFSVVQGNSQKWKNTFRVSPREILAFEYVAGDMLDRLGYERMFTNPRFPVHLRLLSRVDNAWKVVTNRLLRPPYRV